jgi:dTDP-4-dehydrorhamnose reductase
LGHDIIRLGLPDFDLSDADGLAAPIHAAKPDVIISSAAYTAVDKAEAEPDLAQRINGYGPGQLAKIAATMGIPILHMSTDYVFSGDKAGAYNESDRPGPVSVYGRSNYPASGKLRPRPTTTSSSAPPGYIHPTARTS